MNDLREMIDQVCGEPPAEMSQEERDQRKRLITGLFLRAGERDPARIRLFLADTSEIPIEFLAIAVTAIVRSRVYSNLPTAGEVWNLARAAAGMDRERYSAGRYLPPPREWPPQGNRYGVTGLEALPAAETVAKQLAAPATRMLGDGGQS